MKHCDDHGSALAAVSHQQVYCFLGHMTVGTEGAAAAESTALSKLKHQQTGEGRLTDCEKAKSSTGMPAGADMSQPPEIGTDAVTEVIGPEKDMSDPGGTEVLREGMAETAGTGQGPRIGTPGEGLTVREGAQTGIGPATDPSARKPTGQRQALLIPQAALSKLILAKRCDWCAVQHFTVVIGLFVFTVL